MSQPTERTFKIVAAIAIGMSLAPLAVVAVFGEQSEMVQNLAAHGYTEIRMLDSSGTQIEFRSNGTIPIMEDTVAELVNKHGYSLVEFAPAPALQEDSIIIVELNTNGVVF